MREILDAYKNGDMSERTGLFLGYPDLREAFTAIEEAEDRMTEVEPTRSCVVCRLCTSLIAKLGL